MHNVSRGTTYICSSLINAVQAAICHLQCHWLQLAAWVSRDGSGGNINSLEASSQTWMQNQSVTWVFTFDLNSCLKKMGARWAWCCCAAVTQHFSHLITVSSDHNFPPPSSVYDQKDSYCWFWLILSHFNGPCQRWYTHGMVWNQNSSTHVLVNETKISAAHFLVLTLMAGTPCSLDKHTGQEIWSVFSSYLQGM